MLTLNNLSFSFHNNKVLRNINIFFNKGDINCIHGENGKGKSTLIKILTKYYSNYKGDIFYYENNLRDYDKNDWRKIIGICHQNPYLYHDTIWNNLNFVNNTKSEIYYYLKKFKFEEFVDINKERIVDQNINLSGGQQQLISLIRSLSTKKEILILDEPTSHLDNFRKRVLVETLNDMKDKCLIIVVSHDEEFINNCIIHKL